MLLKALTRTIATAATLLFLAEIVPGITVANFYTALIVAVLWGLIMLIVRPVLVLLTLPINLLTFGLFTFVLNALLFWFLATFVAGFHVAGFVPALVGSFALSLVSWVLHAAFK